ncbi:hypothetical protein SUGI_0485560 [Cryptomeria japonica]|nr:hypothetical protein SUGI_0485560 [Cryptomeria japonica]
MGLMSRSGRRSLARVSSKEAEESGDGDEYDEADDPVWGNLSALLFFSATLLPWGSLCWHSWLSILHGWGGHFIVGFLVCGYCRWRDAWFLSKDAMVPLSSGCLLLCCRSTRAMCGNISGARASATREVPYLVLWLASWKSSVNWLRGSWVGNGGSGQLVCTIFSPIEVVLSLL